jgi:hypothetical protein
MTDRQKLVVRRFLLAMALTVVLVVAFSLAITIIQGML